MTRLHLVRHGRPVVDPPRPAAAWELDPAGFDDVWALRDRLPQGATWRTSPEPAALATAQLLTDAEIGVVEGLRAHGRGVGRVDDVDAAVAQAFAEPDVPARAGWEPLARCRERVTGTVRGLLDEQPADGDLVLVGHGTAWTLVVADLRGTEPDPEAWRRFAMPDVVTLDTRAMP